MLKNLYIVHKEKSNKTSSRLLQEAAQQRGLNCVFVNFDQFDFANSLELTDQDAIYRVSMGNDEVVIEKNLMNDKVVTFFTDYRNCLANRSFHMILAKAKMPIIPAIQGYIRDRQKLINAVNKLGGFPIILKEVGLMRGKGINKINNLEQLEIKMQELGENNKKYYFKRYINHQEQARLVVLGNEVIASHVNIVTHDFRTNFGKSSSRKSEAREFDSSIKEMAVKAVKALGLEFGGVDVLFEEETNTPYLAEVNFPCFFSDNSKVYRHRHCWQND